MLSVYGTTFRVCGLRPSGFLWFSGAAVRVLGFWV